MIREVSAFCLDVHAQYQCRGSGACCETWSVPAEPAVVEIVRARRIRRQGVQGELFVNRAVDGDAPSWTVARDTHGECVFFDRGAGGLCLIHRDVDEDALPSACRHFPRRVLHDARGTLISLSHFCPTAARLVLEDGALSIVEAQAPLRLRSRMEGLDADGALPPLLRPGLLCDVEGYDAWERHGIALFARRDRHYAQALDDLAAATERIRTWRPGGAPLIERVNNARDERSGVAPLDQDRAIARVARLTAGRVGGDLASIPDFAREWDRIIGDTPAPWFDRGMKNYLAARLFGNWIAYQGQGLRSIVEWLRTCAAVVHHFLVGRLLESGQSLNAATFIAAVRSADLLLLHVLDSAAFARDVVSLEQ